MPDTPEELSLQNADTNFTSIEENNEAEQNKQRDSIFAAVNNEALTQLSSLQIQLPVEIAASTEVNPDLNKTYTEEPRDIIFIATSFFNNPHYFGAKEIPFKESTKAYIIETSSMFYAYREFARNENDIAEYISEHPEEVDPDLHEKMNHYRDLLWQKIQSIKAEQSTIAPLLESLFPSREALVALMKADSEQFMALTGIEGIAPDESMIGSMSPTQIKQTIRGKMLVFTDILNQILLIDAVSKMTDDELKTNSVKDRITEGLGGTGYTTFFSEVMMLLEKSETAAKEREKNKYMKSEQELVAKKTEETSIFPVSENLRYQLQVIAYNEMPSTPGVIDNLPNLALQLRSLVTAIQQYKEQKGSPSDIEIIYNINNKPNSVPLGNVRSLQFLNGIIGDEPIEDVIKSFDWIPLQTATYSDISPERVAFLNRFYSTLISEARQLLSEGFNIVPIDCTDGAFIATRGDKKPDKDSPQHASQGSRRLLASAVGANRLRQAKVPQQYMMALDSDIMLKPTYFTDLDKIVQKDKNEAAVYQTTPVIVPWKGLFLGDILKRKMPDNTPVINTFTQEQIKLLMSFDEKSDVTVLQLTPEQTAFLDELKYDEIEAIYGRSATNDKYKYADAGMAISLLQKADSQTEINRVYFYYKDFENALRLIHLRSHSDKLGSLLDKFTRLVNPTMQKKMTGGVGFLSCHAVSLKAYEMSPQWDITRDLGEDSSFLDGVKQASGNKVKHFPVDLVRIRDRIRSESWMGGNLSNRSREGDISFPSEKKWRDVINHLKRISLIDQNVVITPVIFPDMLFSLLESGKVKLSPEEKKLVADSQRFTLENVSRDADSSRILNIVEMVRQVIQQPGKYRRLYDFFLPMAAYFGPDEETYQEPMKKAA